MKKPATLQLPCACAAVRHASRLITQIYEEELRGHLAPPQFGLLSLLQALPGCNQATLARRLDLDKTTLSRNLKLLEKSGWIEHIASDDRRERGYHLTPGGAKVLAAAKPAWKRAQDRLRSAMTASQWETMWQTFDHITDATRRSRVKKPQ